MRMTREELKEKFPSWNETRHNIVSVNYGDEPLIEYDEQKYQEYQKLTGTLENIEAVSAYIYSQNGEYSEYRTLVGNVYIGKNGTVLAGSANVKYGGKTYNIILNKMYGFKKLDILRVGVNDVVGFSNKDGQGSPSIYTKEMSVEMINRILNDKMEDYGVGIQKFMIAARELYEEDSTNYIMDKRFGMRKDG